MSSRRWFRARTYYPGYQALIDAQNHRLELNGQKPLKRDDARKMITNYLTGYIENGQIQNRNEILTTLENSGFTITRQGDNYITVSHDDLACIIHERIEKKPESLMQSGIWEFDSNNSL